MTLILASNRPLRSRLVQVCTAIGLAALLAGCGSSEATPGAAGTPSVGPTDMARYVQTWGTDYDHTTCTQWTRKMTEPQRWTAAFELLRDNRGSDAAISAMPADALVERFRADVGTRCGSGAARTTAVSDIASDAYVAGRAGYRG